jgi:esterase/lipase superfamily enzyme
MFAWNCGSERRKHNVDEWVVTRTVSGRVLLELAVLSATVLVAACATRPETGFLLPVTETAAGATERTLLVATTRERDARPGTLYNGERGRPLDYAAVTVSIPRTHVDGRVEWPSHLPGNPSSDFVVRQAAYLEGEKEFVRSLNAQLATRPRGSRKVFLFIHGYNTMFAEGLYRFAQVVHDSDSAAVPVLFSWASRGKVGAYIYDTNSATTARDELEHTLRLLFASDADQVNILAHSMGNWVTVEALRGIKISGQRLPIEKVGSVFLADADIDMDVFKSQMRRFGRPKKPFYVIVSRDDQALRVSSMIAGGRSRLGDDANSEELTALGAIVIDLTDVKSTDGSNHSKFAQIADVAPRLEAVLAKGVGASPDPQAKLPDGGSLGGIVESPMTLLDTPIKTLSSQ